MSAFTFRSRSTASTRVISSAQPGPALADGQRQAADRLLGVVAEDGLEQVPPLRDEEVDRVPGPEPVLLLLRRGRRGQGRRDRRPQIVIGHARDVDPAVQDVAQRFQVARVPGEPVAEGDADPVGEVAGSSPPPIPASR